MSRADVRRDESHGDNYTVVHSHPTAPSTDRLLDRITGAVVFFAVCYFAAQAVRVAAWWLLPPLALIALATAVHVRRSTRGRR